MQDDGSIIRQPKGAPVPDGATLLTQAEADALAKVPKAVRHQALQQMRESGGEVDLARWSVDGVGRVLLPAQRGGASKRKGGGGRRAPRSCLPRSLRGPGRHGR